MKHIHLSLKQVTRMVYASSVLFLLVGILFSAVLTPVEAKRIDEPGSWTSGSGGVTAAAPAAYDTPVGPLDHEAIQLELEAICGYVEEQQTGRFYWVVRNDSALSGEVAWQVVGSTESGGFTIGANETLTFTTTAGAAKTVQLLVHGVVVAEASSLPACKKYLQLTYVCTPDNNLQWAVVNDNLYLDATFTWSLDGGSPVDGGYLGPNQTQNLVVTNNLVDHTITLTWYHWPMGLRTISLTAPAQSCIENTPTPTLTSTPTATLTITPTETATLTVTPTETATPTDTPAPTETLTPTATDTAVPTETATPTEISTPTDTPVPTETSTPTLVNPPTDTPEPTPTFTATVESTATDTPVPTATNTSEVPPPDTPEPTATEVVEFTATSTEVTSGGTPTLPVDATPTLQETQSITNTPGSPATLPPPQPTRNVLIPVTGADLTVQSVSVANPSAFFINLGLVFAGLGLVLTGISKRPRRK